MSESVICLTSALSLAAPSRALDTWLPDPEQLALSAPSIPAASTWQAVGEQVGLPWTHLVTTQYTARAVLLGAATGRASYHHELRARLPYPEQLGPEIAVWDTDALAPVWGDGVLGEPKYFSFFQDAPLFAYNPNHRVKWRAHELLHGACAFYWSPTQTRFGCYLGARLNELLPVVHWYGLDEIGRAACPAHMGGVRDQTLCAACEAAQRPFWEMDAPSPAQRAAWRASAQHALAHLTEELGACQRELDTLTVHPTPRPGLDASSDAIAYMQSHWGRLTAWSFGAWVERFCQVGVDYDDDLDIYMDRVIAAAHALLSGDVTLDLERARQLRARHALRDLAARALVAQEWLTGRAARRVEAALVPALDAAADLCAALLAGEASCAQGEAGCAALMEALVQCAGAFPVAVAQAIPAIGHGFGGIDPVTPAQTLIVEGVSSVAPIWAAQQGEALAARLMDLARSPVFAQSCLLVERLASWLDGQGEVEGAALVRLEGWLRAQPRRDEEAERFGVVPEDVDDLLARRGRLRLHATLRRGRWPAQAVSAALGEGFGEALVVRISAGEAEVMEETPQVAALLDAVACGAWREVASPALVELIEHGWVVWIA